MIINIDRAVKRSVVSRSKANPTNIACCKANPKLAACCKASPTIMAYLGILFVDGGCSANSVEDRGQREPGSGGGSPLFKGFA
jgi:hypothetical protein